MFGQKFAFLLVVFCSHAAISIWLWFLLFLITASSIPGGYYSAPNFFTSSNRFLFRLTLTSWNWLFQWLTSLKKMTSELTYGALNFLNIYLLKVNSVHLSGAKHIYPNSWLLESWVFEYLLILNISFGIFSVCAPSTLCAPQLQSTCHYIVNHYVKNIARESEGCK